jgi:hypothetical protein
MNGHRQRACFYHTVPLCILSYSTSFFYSLQLSVVDITLFPPNFIKCYHKYPLLKCKGISGADSPFKIWCWTHMGRYLMELRICLKSALGCSRWNIYVACVYTDD